MPAVALAQKLSQMQVLTRCLFVGVGREAEKKILDPLAYERISLNLSGIKGVGIIAKIKGGLKSLGGFFHSLKIIRSFKPDLVFGAGAYVSGPVGLAAFFSRVPLVIHEQNRRPGLTNRILGKFADLVFLGDPKGEEFFNSKKTLFTGNPIREEILRIGERRDREKGQVTILVLGGSQGARAINQAMAGILENLEKYPTKIRVIHQSGLEGEKFLRPLYEKTKLDYELKDFFTDMPRVLSVSDLAISRAGALTISELMAASVPSILIPLKSAADDHQSENARSLVEGGAARLLLENDLTPERLWEEILAILRGSELDEMKKNTKGLISPDSADKMAEAVLGLIEKKRGNGK
jgi:UDP-N-acetylglucosamine--N-acetylmuramyl-(pentapeptide) pyrophosphoryl-undecaprenol N-acetylglucosamine transferase